MNGNGFKLADLIILVVFLAVTFSFAVVAVVGMRG